jgi:hypothetical protein
MSLQQQQQQQQLPWELQQQNSMLEQQQQQMRMQQYPGSAQGLNMAAATAATPFAAAQVDPMEPACTAAALSAMPAFDRMGLMQQMLLLSEQKMQLQAMRAAIGQQYPGLTSGGSLGPPTPSGFPPLQVPPTGIDAGSPSPNQLHGLPGMNGTLHSAGRSLPGTAGPLPAAFSFGNTAALQPAFSSSNMAAGQFAAGPEQQLGPMQAQQAAQQLHPHTAISAAASHVGNAGWPCAAAMPVFKSAPASKQASLGGQSGSIAEAMADLAGFEECDDFDLFTKSDRPNGLSPADALTSEFAATFPDLDLGMGDLQVPVQQQQQLAPQLARPQQQQKMSQVQMLMQQQIQLTAAMGAGCVPNPSTGPPGMDPAAPLMANMLPCSSSAGTAALGGSSSCPASVAVSAAQQQMRSGTSEHQEMQLQHLMQTVQVLQESIKELAVRVHGRSTPAPMSSPGTGIVGSFGDGPVV